MDLLKTQHLSVAFDGIHAVEDVSLSVRSGTITSIIGPNGAGKTTLFNLVNGYIRQDGGAILYRDKHIDLLPSWQRALMGIGRLWQDIRLSPNMTVLENLLVARKNQRGEMIWKCLLRPRRVSESERENRVQASDILELIGLEHKQESLARNLSYGQQKLLALGRLLMNDAELLLLDEPLAGVNPLMIDEILSLIVRLATDGKTVVMIEHNVPKALSISDLVYVMSQGQIELAGTPTEVSADPMLREVYLGV